MGKVFSGLLLSGALLSGVLLGLYAAGPALGAGPVREVAVTARPLPLASNDRAAGRIGRLRFLGALTLRSNDRRFGGISGMLFDAACNQLLAVTDSGSWIVLAPIEEDGRLVDLRRGWIAPILNLEGQPPASKPAADAEEVAAIANGDLFVSYEQQHRLEQFHGLSACNPATLAQPPIGRHVLAEAAGWPANGGAEAVGGDGDALLLLSEAMPAGDGRRQGLRWQPGGADRPAEPVAADGLAGPDGAAALAQPGRVEGPAQSSRPAQPAQSGKPAQPATRFSWPVPDGHQPTAMGLFTDGGGRRHLLVLHRRASLLGGFSAVITEAVLGEDGLPGESRPVARLGPPLTVDNMEALAVRAEGGRVFVYLASDDNFNRLQQTLLLKFELLPESD